MWHVQQETCAKLESIFKTKKLKNRPKKPSRATLDCTLKYSASHHITLHFFFSTVQYSTREFKICYGEALLRRQEVAFISGIFTAHARVWVSGRSRTVRYGKTTKLAYCWLRECLLPLFLCFIGCFTAYRLDQFIEEALVNGLRFEVILLFGLAQFSSDNFGRYFSHSGPRTCLQQDR